MACLSALWVYYCAGRDALADGLPLYSPRASPLLLYCAGQPRFLGLQSHRRCRSGHRVVQQSPRGAGNSRNQPSLGLGSFRCSHGCSSLFQLAVMKRFYQRVPSHAHATLRAHFTDHVRFSATPQRYRPQRCHISNCRRSHLLLISS